MNAALFASPAHLEAAFAQGLDAMLSTHDGLGVYILALANAAFDPALWTPLQARLAERHARHAHALTATLREGKRVQAPEDDLMVFLKLMAMGFNAIRTPLWRNAGPWRIQFNPLRALRPPRASQTRITTLQQPFDARGFHFNKPFLAKEILWQGVLADKPVRLLYNKFPFAPLHGLITPAPERNLPQWLTPEMHDWAWRCCAELGRNLPGLGLAYNSLGAQASVNHLHLQSFMQADALPVCAPAFRHNGGSTPYPIPCLRCDGLEQAWFELDALHASGTPYNLVYRPDVLYLLPRRMQSEATLPDWCAGMAWSELAGVMTVFNREDFDSLQEPGIMAALSALAVPSFP